MSRRRKLSEEDKQLWRRVADTTERLGGPTPKLALPAPKPTSKVIPDPKPAPPPAIKQFVVGSRSRAHQTTLDLAPTIANSLAQQNLQMDKKKFGKLKRGKLLPEGRIDLHGLNLQQAHGALTGFIYQSHTEGKRLVLVITGKGKVKDDGGPIPTRIGVLKHQVPQWLRMAPLASRVMQVSEAHIRHGGSGAYYVYLRR